MDSLQLPCRAPPTDDASGGDRAVRVRTATALGAGTAAPPATVDAGVPRTRILSRGSPRTGRTDGSFTRTAGRDGPRRRGAHRTAGGGISHLAEVRFPTGGPIRYLKMFYEYNWVVGLVAAFVHRTCSR